MSRICSAIAALTFVLASSSASAQALWTAETAKGRALVDAKGMTLYTFDNDAGGKSMCNGPCAENWPPLLASVDARPTGDMTIVTRVDGRNMWAYKGKPRKIPRQARPTATVFSTAHGTWRSHDRSMNGALRRRLTVRAASGTRLARRGRIPGIASITNRERVYEFAAGLFDLDPGP